MAEKRLIDANAMRDDWLENGENEYVYDTNAVLDSIDSQPSVDAVEVVRCRDCSRANQYDDGSDNYVCRLGGTRKGSDFCSEGERREENE